MNWISVKDKVPMIGEYVLVYVSDKCFQMTNIVVTLYDKYGFNISNVTHWMPLPGPPKD